MIPDIGTIVKIIVEEFKGRPTYQYEDCAARHYSFDITTNQISYLHLEFDIKKPEYVWPSYPCIGQLTSDQFSINLRVWSQSVWRMLWQAISEDNLRHAIRRGIIFNNETYPLFQKQSI